MNPRLELPEMLPVPSADLLQAGCRMLPVAAILKHSGGGNDILSMLQATSSLCKFIIFLYMAMQLVPEGFVHELVGKQEQV